MKSVIIVLIVLVVLGLIAVGAFMFLMSNGAKLEDFEHLLEPSITSMEDQKVIQVKTVGDPDESAGDAIGVLYKSYYSIEGISKKGKPPWPLARWDADFSAPDSEWVGYFALRVPDKVDHIQELTSKSGYLVALRIWQYGEVAEILHVGSYDNEQETVDKLKTFIDESGYEIVGKHEEEYLKGPGMFGKGNPDKYLTIIRYPVAPVAVEEEVADTVG